MTDQLEAWEMALPFGRKHDGYMILHDQGGLRIVMTDVYTDADIELVYDKPVLYYEYFDEGYWIKDVERLLEEYGKPLIHSHTFFVVRESSLIKRLEAESHGALRAEDLFHLKVVEGDGLIDIVSFDPPRMRFLNEGERPGGRVARPTEGLGT